MYSDMLGELQGRTPAEMHLALGGVQGERVSFRVTDYVACYRLVACEFEAVLRRGLVYPLATTPEPVEHCGVCRWSLECRAQWRAEDDLSLVAGLTSRPRRARRAERMHAQGNIQVHGERARRTISERAAPARERAGGLVEGYGERVVPAHHPGAVGLVYILSSSSSRPVTALSPF